MKRNDILSRYSWQFRAGRSIDHSIPDCWLPALAALCAAVDELVDQGVREQFCWLDIKEKHSQLAVDYSAPTTLTSAIEALVETAESTCHATGGIVHGTREQADQVRSYQDDSMSLSLTDALQANTQLVAITPLSWLGLEVAVWLPVGSDSKALSGAILYLEDMPPTLREVFTRWLAQQVLSISRPPLGLPKQGPPTSWRMSWQRLSLLLDHIVEMPR